MFAVNQFKVSDGLFVSVTASHTGIKSIHLLAGSPDGSIPATDPLLIEAARQIQAYFRGKLRAFDLPLDLQGTEFQKRVWSTLLTIPYGETRSYAWLAGAVDCPKGFRAVGAANGANPVCIVVPCHRVIASGGGLGGYALGLDIKRRLLDLERNGQWSFSAGA